MDDLCFSIDFVEWVDGSISPRVEGGFVTPTRRRAIGHSKQPFRLAGSTAVPPPREMEKSKLFLTSMNQSSTPSRITVAQQQTELSPPRYGNVSQARDDYSLREQRDPWLRIRAG